MISIIPFPAELLETAWGWLQECRRFNFDDYGPRTLDEFVEHMAARSASEMEYLWAVTLGGEAVGMIGVTRPAERLAVFHGICFTKRVHRKGVALEAVQAIIDGLHSSGVERIEASFFADNGRVRRFFQKLGLSDEGTLRARTLRDAKPVDVRVMGLVLPVRVAELVAVEVAR